MVPLIRFYNVITSKGFSDTTIRFVETEEVIEGISRFVYCLCVVHKTLFSTPKNSFI